jgi:hypothetical protein
MKLNKIAAKQAIANFCSGNRKHLDAQFVDPLTDVEFNNSTNPENWFLTSEIDPEYAKECMDEYGEDIDFDDCYDGFSFDCEPFDDQLRAYVSVDMNGSPTKVHVQGE